MSADAVVKKPRRLSVVTALAPTDKPAESDSKTSTSSKPTKLRKEQTISTATPDSSVTSPNGKDKDKHKSSSRHKDNDKHKSSSKSKKEDGSAGKDPANRKEKSDAQPKDSILPKADVASASSAANTTELAARSSVIAGGSLRSGKQTGIHSGSPNAKSQGSWDSPARKARSRSLPPLPSWSFRSGVRPADGPTGSSAPDIPKLGWGAPIGVGVHAPSVAAQLEAIAAASPTPRTPKLSPNGNISSDDESDDEPPSLPATPRKKERMVNAFDWMKTFDSSTLATSIDIKPIKNEDEAANASEDEPYEQETWNLLNEGALDDSDGDHNTLMPSTSSSPANSSPRRQRRVFNREESAESSSTSATSERSHSHRRHPSNTSTGSDDENHLSVPGSANSSPAPDRPTTSIPEKWLQTASAPTTPAQPSNGHSRDSDKRSPHRRPKRPNPTASISITDTSAPKITKTDADVATKDDSAIFKKPLKPVSNSKRDRRRTEARPKPADDNKDAAAPAKAPTKVPAFKKEKSDDNVVVVRRPSIRSESINLSPKDNLNETRIVKDRLAYTTTANAKDGKSRKVLVAGHLDALINMTVAVERDFLYIHNFLAAFPFFTTPTVILDHFATKCFHPGDENKAKDFDQTQTRIIELLQEWIKSYFVSFKVDPTYKPRLLKFISESVKGSVHDKLFGSCELMRRVVVYQSAGINPSDLASLAVKMKSPNGGLKLRSGIRPNFLGSEALKWLQQLPELSEADCVDICNQLIKEKLIICSKTASDPSHFKKTRKYYFSVSRDVEASKLVQHLKPAAEMKQTSRFSSFQPLAFAKQLALFELTMFKQIQLHELHYWVKGDKDKRAEFAPNLNQAVDWTNKVSAFVTTEIVTTPNPKHRLAILKQFILVCQYCLKFKNYQGLLEIIYGLQNTAVSRLHCWKELQPKYKEMFDKLAEIVSPGVNWKCYRPLIDTESPPCVPYLGLILADLTFISDGNPTKLEDGMINWKKVQRINHQLTRVLHFQSGSLDFPAVPDILRFLSEELYSLDEKELFAKSRQLEPARPRSNSVY